MSASPNKSSSYQQLSTKIENNSIKLQKQEIKDILVRKYILKYPKKLHLREEILAILEQKLNSSNKINQNSLQEIENNLDNLIQNQQNNKSLSNVQEQSSNPMQNQNQQQFSQKDNNFLLNNNLPINNKQNVRLPKISSSSNLINKNNQLVQSNPNIYTNNNIPNNSNQKEIQQSVSPESKQNQYQLFNKYNKNINTPRKNLNSVSGRSNKSLMFENNAQKIIKQNDIYIFDNTEKDQWGQIVKFKDQLTNEQMNREKQQKRESQMHLQDFLKGQMQSKVLSKSESQQQIQTSIHLTQREINNKITRQQKLSNNQININVVSKKNKNNSENAHQQFSNLYIQNQILDEQRLKKRQDKTTGYYQELDQQRQQIENSRQSTFKINNKIPINSQKEESFLDIITNKNAQQRKQMKEHENNTQQYLQQQMFSKYQQRLLKSDLNNYEQLDNQDILKLMYEQQLNKSVGQRLHTDY